MTEGHEKTTDILSPTAVLYGHTLPCAPYCSMPLISVSYPKYWELGIETHLSHSPCCRSALRSACSARCSGRTGASGLKPLRRSGYRCLPVLREGVLHHYASASLRRPAPPLPRAYDIGTNVAVGWLPEPGVQMADGLRSGIPRCPLEATTGLRP